MFSDRLLFVVSLLVAVVVPDVSAAVLKDSFKAKFPTFPLCFIGNHKVVRVGETWYDRCRKCVCDAKEGVICDGPKCAIPYKPYHNETCAKWSADQCCCEEIGCAVGEKVYQIGQYYPFPANDPCGECLCEHDTDQRKCFSRVCPPEVCVDAIRISGECCKRCLTGPNCRFPFLEGVDMFNNRALRKPLLFTTTELVQSDADPFMFYECQCMIPGGTTFCTPKPFSITR